MNVWRQNANDRLRRGIEIDGLPDHIRTAAKPCVPQRVADQYDGLSFRVPFVRRERSPHVRLDAKNRKEVRRDSRDRNLLRLAMSSQVERIIRDRGDTGERLSAVAQLLKACQRAASVGCFPRAFNTLQID